MRREYEVGGRKLEIHLGDITQLVVDAIVNSENSDLIMDRPGGPSVSGAIRALEGDGMAEALARLGPIEPGRAVVTPASKLFCRWIVHAASVVKTEEGHRTSLPWIREAVRSSLQLAAGLGLESIAFPAFGVRATDVGSERSSEAMVEELVAGLRQPTSLRRIVVALLDPSTFLTFFEQAMARATQANEPLTLRITHQPEALGFAFEDAGPVAQVARAPFPSGVEAELEQRLAPLLDHGGRRLRDLEGELQALGGALNQLLPPEVRERLRAEPERALRLQLDERVAGIPFELARDGQRYLAERPLDRRLISSAPARPPVDARPRERLEALVLAGGLSELPSSAREGEAVLDLLWRRAAPRARLTHLADRRATRAAVLAALPRAELLHWCGHTERAQERVAWCLGEGTRLGAEDVASQPLAARLVFLNTCGRAGNQVMARAFLLAGARNVVSTLWDVADEPARRFALHCYEELCLGRTLGEALLAARRQLRAEGAIHWLAYQHYGDGRERVFEPMASGARR
ncbi:MAG: CHAT domain-containing protein [Planctomycetota bacterium]